MDSKLETNPKNIAKTIFHTSTNMKIIQVPAIYNLINIYKELKIIKFDR